MATANHLSRQSRRAKLTKAFVGRAVQGKEGPGPWTDTESPLRFKRTASGGQYYAEKKLEGRKRTYTPKAADGSALKNTAVLWTLDEARAWARGVVVDVARGISPEPERRPPRGDTFAKFAADPYMVEFARTHPSETSRRSEGYGVKYANEVLGDLPLEEIDAEAAARLKARYAGSPANARKAWGATSRVLGMAVERGLIAVNIFAAIKAPKAPDGKARYPRLEELARIERACLETRGVGAEIVRFLMRFPLRPDTAASLTWGEVDVERGELNLRPAPGRKFRGEQRLPLPALAVELLEALKPEEPKANALVFPSDSPKNPGGKFSGWSRLYARLRARSVGGWSAHDFRRSCVSLVAELRPDISEEALDRLLTHAQSSTNAGVKRVYQRAQGFASMKAAAKAWDAILRGALSGTVVPMRRAG